MMNVHDLKSMVQKKGMGAHIGMNKRNWIWTGENKVKFGHALPPCMHASAGHQMGPFLLRSEVINKDMKQLTATQERLHWAKSLIP